MSAKRPRPAIPVLVHVDNPTEAASVTVDTSTIESKMNTVINNQERIYNKIPTSTGGGGGSADLTTVNENTTALAETIGPPTSITSDNNIFGTVKNIKSAIGNYHETDSLLGTTVKSRLYNIQSSLGNATVDPTSTGTTVRDLLSQIKTATGTADSGLGAADLLGLVKNVRSAIGPYNTTVSPRETTVRSFLYNLCQAVGDSFNAPTTTENTVRGLLTAIKENTASGDDLTTVNEKITAINAAVGDGAVLANDQSLIGLAKGIKASLGPMSATDALSSSNIKGRLYNIQSSIGDALNSPTTTGTTVRDLLAAIKENTASGGGGSSTDMTTVNEKTTALAAAIGNADDDSSTVSVIGLLRKLASLKVWHFIESPFTISDSLFTISFYDYMNAKGYAEWTGWNLPDISIMEYAHKEYLGYMLVDYRPNNTANWQSFPLAIRYNTNEFGHNILKFLPYSLDQSTYSAVHLDGGWTVRVDSTNNRWTIIVTMMAYLSNDSRQSFQNSDLVKIESMSIRGINIYY